MARTTRSCVAVTHQAANKIRDWQGAGPADHFVQFYRTDEYLIECLASYAAEGLVNGEPVVVIATEPHRAALQERLRIKRLDVGSASLQPLYQAHDAAQLLGRVFDRGRLSRAAFEEVIGAILRRAAALGPRVRAFGELVSLLWQDKQREAALEIEAEWNRLAERHAFRLFCAYRSAGFAEKGDDVWLDRICAAHTHLVSLTA